MKIKTLILTWVLAMPVPVWAEMPLIAIVDFDTTSVRYNMLGRQFAELIGNAVINSGTFDVLEREKLDTILKEQAFANSAMVDPNNAVQMGAMLGAPYLMTGKVISANIGKKKFSGYGVTSTKTTFVLKASTRVLDTRTGRVMFSSTETASSSTQGTGNLNVSTGGGSFVSLAEKIAYRFADKLAKRSAKFQPKKTEEVTMVKVNVTSSPEAADVEVDGIFYGNAGSEVELPSGLKTVKISLPGYDVWQKKVMVREGMNIRATLRKSADLRIMQGIE